MPYYAIEQAVQLADKQLSTLKEVVKMERLTTPFERQVDMIKVAVSRLQRTTTWDMSPERIKQASQYLDELYFLVMDAKAAL